MFRKFFGFNKPEINFFVKFVYLRAKKLYLFYLKDGRFFSLWKQAVENTYFWGERFLLWSQFIYKSNIIYFFLVISSKFNLKLSVMLHMAYCQKSIACGLWAQKTLPYGKIFLTQFTTILLCITNSPGNNLSNFLV